MLQNMQSLVHEYDGENKEITFKVKATGLVQYACEDVALALKYHEEIEEEHLTPRGKHLLVPIQKWKKLKQFMIDALSR